MGTHVLVTGGTGFIGSHLVATLCDAGYEVVTLSRRPGRGPAGVEHLALDVADASAIERIGVFDAIVHLAAEADASASFADPLGYSRTNALGTLNLLEVARRSGARFVFASSQRIYRSDPAPVVEDAPKLPLDPYAYAKLIGEQWVRMYGELFGVRTTVTRFFSVYGPGQVQGAGTSGVVAIFVNRARRGEPLRVGDGNRRDFTYVTDVVRGVRLALESPAAVGRTYNIATGVASSIVMLARAVKDATGSSSPIVIAGEECREAYIADITRARQELGYEPRVGLRQGLECYVEYLSKRASAAQGEADARTTA